MIDLIAPYVNTIVITCCIAIAVGGAIGLWNLVRAYG
jgi:hypothetical protein